MQEHEDMLCEQRLEMEQARLAAAGLQAQVAALNQALQNSRQQTAQVSITALVFQGSKYTLLYC